MDRAYEQLISQYQVSSQSQSAKDWLAYFTGGFLLVAPVIPGLAVPMAVIGLTYFLLVFSLLLSLDLNQNFKPALKKHFSYFYRAGADQIKRLMLKFEALSYSLASSFKNSPLLIRARAR